MIRWLRTRRTADWRSLRCRSLLFVAGMAAQRGYPGSAAWRAGNVPGRMPPDASGESPAMLFDERFQALRVPVPLVVGHGAEDHRQDLLRRLGNEEAALARAHVHR